MPKFLLIVLAALLFVGCRAKPAPDAGFIEQPHLMTMDDKAAFQRGYWDPNVNFKSFDELYVAEVNMHYMMTQNFWEKANEMQVSEEDVKMSATRIADYTREAFIKAAQNDPKHRLKVVDKPGPKTLVLETAIVQLVPSKAVLQALGYVSWIPSAVAVAGSVATQSEDQGKGVVAIEGRVKNGGTGKVIAMFAGREHPPAAIVDIKSLNWWAPAKKIVDDWAKQFVATVNDPKAKVKRAGDFELLVW